MALLKFADLFSGCGGFSYGFANNKHYEGLLAVDSWAAAVDVLKANLTVPGEVKDLADQKSQEWVVGQLADRIDVLLGGPPCQGFSTLGLRRAHDHRSSLVDVYMKLARKIRPAVILMENVRGITSMQHQSGTTYPVAMQAILNPHKRKKDWLCGERMIDMLQFGIPQTRTRYLFVAVRADLPNSSRVIERILRELDVRPSTAIPTLRTHIGDLPRVRAGEGSDVAVDPNTGRIVFNHQAMNHGRELLARLKHVPPGGGLLDVPSRLLTPHLRKMVSGAYGSGGHVKNIYGRMLWDQPSGTIVAGIDKITCGRFVHPDENRLLTPRECARIQSFADDFRFAGSLVNQYYMIGNAVPPRFSAALAGIVAAALKDRGEVRQIKQTRKAA